MILFHEFHSKSSSIGDGDTSHVQHKLYSRLDIALLALEGLVSRVANEGLVGRQQTPILLQSSCSREFNFHLASWFMDARAQWLCQSSSSSGPGRAHDFFCAGMSICELRRTHSPHAKSQNIAFLIPHCLLSNARFLRCQVIVNKCGPVLIPGPGLTGKANMAAVIGCMK